MCFDRPPTADDGWSDDLRARIHPGPGGRLFLQPTRVVPRKGIEHAIDLLRELGNPHDRLVVSHDAGDEGLDYLHSLERRAAEAHVDLCVISDLVDTKRSTGEDGKKRYTLEDVYPLADFVTFPSLYEGFGNALLEAIYFRKPLLVNRYEVFRDDIGPLGFNFAVMDGRVTSDTVDAVRTVLEDDGARRRAVNHNFELARHHFGFDTLRRGLSGLFAELGLAAEAGRGHSDADSSSDSESSRSASSSSPSASDSPPSASPSSSGGA